MKNFNYELFGVFVVIVSFWSFVGYFIFTRPVVYNFILKLFSIQ